MVYAAAEPRSDDGSLAIRTISDRGNDRSCNTTVSRSTCVAGNYANNTLCERTLALRLSDRQYAALTLEDHLPRTNVSTIFVFVEDRAQADRSIVPCAIFVTGDADNDCGGSSRGHSRADSD
jgi:hypothetical protein